MAKDLNNEILGYRERIAFGRQATVDGLGRYSVAVILVAFQIFPVSSEGEANMLNVMYLSLILNDY